MSSVQNHPLDLTTSPGCSSRFLITIKPTIILAHFLLVAPHLAPGREQYTVVQVYLLHVSSTWHLSAFF